MMVMSLKTVLAHRTGNIIKNGLSVFEIAVHLMYSDDTLNQSFPKKESCNRVGAIWHLFSSKLPKD